MAPLGLAMIGLGVSLSGEATLLKGAEAPLWQWVSLGTAGLVALNSGIAIFGDAVKRRFWWEWEQRSEASTSIHSPL